MNIETYYRSKGPRAGLTRAEAVVLGIPHPLTSGWLRRHGATLITEEQRRVLAQFALHSRRTVPLGNSEASQTQLNLFDGSGDQ